ncbi:MAG: hemolysin III family protein [Treponema sp.]|nr:hemolysin III family protein [Candidatus Treponema caballi]
MTAQDNDSQAIVEYEKTPHQIAEEKIRAIKAKAREDIAEVRKQLLAETIDSVVDADKKAYKKEMRRRNREAKRAEYLNRKTRYTVGEEIFHSISHGIGMGLAIAATVLLICHAAAECTPELKPYMISSYAIFGASLILVYLVSTLYHALTPIGVKKVFNILDHAFIYVLIAGTYTPFCLGALHNGWGWSLFGVIWLLSIVGIVFYSIFGSKMRFIAAFTYFILGWLVTCFFKPIREVVPDISILFLILGGVLYTIGAYFYTLKSVKWMHSVWHVLVIGGSVLHFFAVWFLI